MGSNAAATSMVIEREMYTACEGSLDVGETSGTQLSR